MSKPGNRNAIRSGTSSYVTTDRLPRGASYAGRIARQFKKALTDAAEAIHGPLTIDKACLIQSCVRHEMRAQLLLRLMRTEKNISADQVITLTKEISSATDARDRCVKALGIVQPPDSGPDFSSLLSLQPAPARPDSSSASGT
jgi:hypothetical protein